MAVPWIPGQRGGARAGEKWLPPVDDGGPPETVSFKQFDGASWVNYVAVPKVWNGTGWDVVHPQRWDGVRWKYLL